MSRGTTIYLYANIDTLLERTSKDRNRPLLQTENPRERLEALFDARRPIYLELADLAVKTDRKQARKLASEIINQLPEHLL